MSIGVIKRKEDGVHLHLDATKRGRYVIMEGPMALRFVKGLRSLLDQA
jgi:hypothetical protein